MKITRLLPTPERMPSREAVTQHPPEVRARVEVVSIATQNVERAKKNMGFAEQPVSQDAEKQADERVSYPDITGRGYTAISDDNVALIRSAADRLAQPASVMQGGVDAYNQAA